MEKSLLQASLFPEPAGKEGIIDLEAVIDADSLATLGAGGGCLHGQGPEEANVVAAQGAREEGGQQGDLGGGIVQLGSQIDDGEWRFELRPRGGSRGSSAGLLGSGSSSRRRCGFGRLAGLVGLRHGRISNFFQER